MDLFKIIDPDFGEDYSDEELSAESSEDDIDIILHGTPEQKRKLYQKTKHSKSSDESEEDDFEKEMNKELDDKLKAIEFNRLTNQSQDADKKSGDQIKDTNDIQKFYDDIYFDSDDEDQNDKESKKTNSKHPVVSNDDLLYDPDMDDQDQIWVDKQRKECRPKTSSSVKTKDNLPCTDGVLNCPACMTTLCRDCQRHETYPNQYRAMFVFNCVVNLSETLKYPKEQDKKKKRKKKKATPEINDTDSKEDEDIYHPVKCSECQTVVAVYDKDEIYYFFNVLAGYS